MRLNHEGDIIHKPISSIGSTTKIPLIDGVRDLDYRFRPTDLANLELFAILAKDKIIFCTEHSAWYRYNGKFWQEDKHESGPEAIAEETIKTLYLIASQEGDLEKRKSMVLWAQGSESESKRMNMIRGARRMATLQVSASTFDKDDYLFNCNNGTLDLKTVRLGPHDPTDMITKISPCDFIPEASSSLWEDTITRALEGNIEIIDFLQKYAGLSLTGNVNQKLFSFLYGSKGHNGKSTIVEALLNVAGDYGLKISVNTLMASVSKSASAATPDIAKMDGKRLVVTSETEKDVRLNDQLIKDLTGRDKISARKLYSDQYDFQPKMKLWMYGNNKPPLNGSSQAMRKRLRLIPFNYQFQGDGDDPDAQDKLKLKEHADGILAWMVKGYEKFIQEGLPEPAQIAAATDQYFYENNKLQAFFDENYVQDPNGELKFSDVYSEATDFLGWKISKKKFSDVLKHDLGFDVTNGVSNVKIIKGWRPAGTEFIPF